MKRIFTILIIIISLFSVSFANSPIICSATPEKLTNYFSSIINLLNKAKSSNPTNNWWLVWLWQKTLQNGIWWASILLFFTFDWLSNFFQNFFVIFHQSYIVRDWVKLINFKPYLTNKFLELWKNGWLYKPLSDKIKSSLKEQEKSNIFFVLKFVWNNYKDFIKYLRKNQLALEELYFKIVVNKEISNCNNLDSTFIKEIEPLLGDFPISKQNLQKVCTFFKTAYLQSNWQEFICDKSLKETKKELSKLKNFSIISSDTAKRFKCNWQRLKNALFWSTISPECQNYWSVKLVKWWHVGIKWKINIEAAGDIIFNLTTNHKWKTIDTSNFNPDFSLLKIAWKKISNFFNSLKTPEIKKYKTSKKNLITDKEDFINKINDITYTLSEAKKNTSVDFAWVYPGWIWKDVWPKFPILSYYIWKWICIISSNYPWCKEWLKFLSWLKLNTEPGIYENLVETCENESPHEWNCHYPK